ncbi:MAG: phosphotransferase [Chloroflexi bacterium]|nr:phosphotransferase [Chloroflexota bacterium]
MFSNRLGEIKAEQLQAALDYFDLGKLRRAEPVPAGLFGQNVFLFGTTGDYVLRGAPHYDWQFPAEQFFAGLLHSKGVKAPYPYLICNDTKIFGWQFALMPKLPGLNAADPATRDGLSFEDRLEIARVLGQNLAQMHQVKWEFSGTYSLASRTIQPFPSSFGDWVKSQVRRNLAKARGYSQVTTVADEEWLEEKLLQWSGSLEVPFEPCYIHHDYREANAVVTRERDGWVVSGVFDLMEGFFGDGDADLVRQVFNWIESGENPAIPGEFVRSYREVSPLRPGYRDRLQLYMLNDASLIWEYFHRPGHAWHSRPGDFRNWAEPYIRFFADM